MNKRHTIIFFARKVHTVAGLRVVCIGTRMQQKSQAGGRFLFFHVGIRYQVCGTKKKHIINVIDAFTMLVHSSVVTAWSCGLN